MRKSSSPQETQQVASDKKRRSRRKSESESSTVEVDTEAARPPERLENRAEEAQKRAAEPANDVGVRKQVEAQRQRLEEALLIAKERKRAEESTSQVTPARKVEVRPSSANSFVSEGSQSQNEETLMPSVSDSEGVKTIDLTTREKGITLLSENGDLFDQLLERLNSKNSEDRASALNDLSRITRDQAFLIINKAFDDPSPQVRNAAAKALYSLEPDPASTFTRALRDASPERRRQIGSSLAASGLASDALGRLSGAGREKTHEALALLFLMARAGEIKPLMSTIEDGKNLEVRLAAVNLLALSGRSEIIPPFRRMAVRGSLPSEVRSAVMEAIYQLSAQQREMVSSD